MLDDYDRDDLTDAQKDRRVGLQMGIAGVSDGVGLILSPLGAFAGPGAPIAVPVVGFASAMGASVAANAGIDWLTDNSSWARGTFGNWS